MLLSRRRVFSARALEIPRGRTNELLQPHTHTKMNLTILRRMGRRDLDRRARSRRGRESFGRRVGDGVISRRATVIVFPGIPRDRVCRCEAAARRGHLHTCNPGAEMRSARRFGARISGLAARDGRSRDVLTSRRYEPPQSLHSSASGAGGFVSETSAFGTSAKRAAKGLAPMQLQLVVSLELVELAAPMLAIDSCRPA